VGTAKFYRILKWSTKLEKWTFFPFFILLVLRRIKSWKKWNCAKLGKTALTSINFFHEKMSEVGLKPAAAILWPDFFVGGKDFIFEKYFKLFVKLLFNRCSERVLPLRIKQSITLKWSPHLRLYKWCMYIHTYTLYTQPNTSIQTSV
jgi:hypothetical protein